MVQSRATTPARGATPAREHHAQQHQRGMTPSRSNDNNNHRAMSPGKSMMMGSQHVVAANQARPRLTGGTVAGVTHKAKPKAKKEAKGTRPLGMRKRTVPERLIEVVEKKVVRKKAKTGAGVKKTTSKAAGVKTTAKAKMDAAPCTTIKAGKRTAAAVKDKRLRESSPQIVTTYVDTTTPRKKTPTAAKPKASVKKAGPKAADKKTSSSSTASRVTKKSSSKSKSTGTSRSKSRSKSPAKNSKAGRKKGSK